MTGETGRYNCDIDISGKFLYNLEKTFPKQEKNALSHAIDYEGIFLRGVSWALIRILLSFFPKSYTAARIQETILKLLSDYHKKCQREQSR